MAPKAHHPPPNPRRFGEPEPEPEQYGRSRTSLKNERVNNELALSELAEQLLEQSPDTWTSLGLSEAACEALRSARLIKSYAAKNRQLRLVRARLRDLDWMSVRAQLDQRRAGFVDGAWDQKSEQARVWAEQLLVQKDEGLERFVQEFQAKNRQRLRQLVRNVLQAGEGKRHRARVLLTNAVQEVISGVAERSEVEPPSDEDEAAS
jgi:ribosomal 50S subunit-associated protein YjgA (DUF615 family)